MLRGRIRRNMRISIHALREEGDGKVLCMGRRKQISIHALREEGDRFLPALGSSHRHFYPRPPRGGRQCSLTFPKSLLIFLSTPSARRATVDKVDRT